jgi:RNA polymerase sigma factor (sigma-70 family)
MSLAARTLNSIPDEELVRLFQSSGEPDCFGELFARYRRRVYYACRGFFYEGSAAEDATQETFLRAFENLHTFVGGNFGGWLMRIAKNVCIDQWRKQKPEPGPADVELDKLPAAGAFDPWFWISTATPCIFRARPFRGCAIASPRYTRST